MEIVFDVPVVLVIQLIAGVILPVLVGLVTSRVTSSNRKAVLLLALSFLSSLLTELIASANAGTAYNLGLGLMTGLATFIVGVATHYGLWKPTGVSTRAQELGTSNN